MPNPHARTEIDGKDCVGSGTDHLTISQTTVTRLGNQEFPDPRERSKRMIRSCNCRPAGGAMRQVASYL
jgi:hypothetical protein